MSPSYIEDTAGKHGLAPSFYSSAVELADFFHCRNVTYATVDQHHTADSFPSLRKYDGLIVNVDFHSEAGRAAAKELSQVSLQYPNLVAGFIDDFSSAISRGAGTVQELEELAANLKSANRSLKLHGVCYTMHFGVDLGAYVPYFDAIWLWVWDPKDLKSLDAHVAEAARLYRKPLHLGLYYFDWSRIDFDRKDRQYWAHAFKTWMMPKEMIQFQCERARQYLKDGRIEAIHILGSFTRSGLKTRQARWLADFCRSL